MAGAPEVPAKRFKGAGGAAAPALETYEVRYRLPIEAEAALSLNGSEIEGYMITVRIDETSKDRTKIIVEGLPAAVGTEELKGLFSGAGQVVYAGPPKKAFGFGGNFGGKGGGGGGGGGTSIGEVRYESPEEAQQALLLLNGSQLEGCTVNAILDQSSKDNSKLILTGLPGGMQWQDLKDHCMQAGRVAFVGVKPGVAAGGCGFGGGGFGGGGFGGGGGNFGGGGGGALEAEVRFDDPNHALQAFEQLNGSVLGGSQIRIKPDPNSKDSSRIIVSGFPASVQWQELKDHFNVIGTVAFAQVKSKSAAPAMAPMGMPMVPWGGKGLPAAGKGMFGKGVQMFGKPAMMNAAAQMFEQWYGAPAMGGAWGGGGGGKAFAPSRGKGGGSGGPGSGEVRYDMPAHARMAVAKLNGSFLQGSRLSVRTDETSQDGSKVIVDGIPPGCQWQEVKDHFGQVGQVAFASIVGPGEVRMETPEEAQRAVAMLNGSDVFGSKIGVVLDKSSKDGTRMQVTGLPSSVNWQQIKDVFGQAGTVAFATRQEAR